MNTPASHYEACGICHAAICEHTISAYFGAFRAMDLQIGDNETADLFTVDYKRVAIVVLPRGERPRYVLHDGRVFSYYAHTTVHGQKEICHPFREVTGLYVSTRPMVSA